MEKVNVALEDGLGVMRSEVVGGDVKQYNSDAWGKQVNFLVKVRDAAAAERYEHGRKLAARRVKLGVKVLHLRVAEDGDRRRMCWVHPDGLLASARNREHR